MRRLLFYVYFLCALLIEIIGIGLCGSWHLYLVKIGFFIFLISGQMGLTRLVFALFAIALSALVQGQLSGEVILYHLGCALLWGPLDRIVVRDAFAHSVAASLFMTGSLLVDKNLLWTPTSAILNILLIPFLVQLRCKV
ncbi:TPA: hypothetical protein DDZ86_02620 [Candidatus Dependentiae bacterium]|nr:MAG: hypothetical protein UW09_C0001G0125 [candidate division TM6 bacterium GW2011_GWF2_43_87]HBL98512.1 hypothetical protein [Candidatus Dependentiae bacterium]